jgi:hypothetical protein
MLAGMFRDRLYDAHTPKISASRLCLPSMPSAGPADVARVLQLAQ